MLFCAIIVALTPMCMGKPLDAEEVMVMLETLQAKVETLENQIKVQDEKNAAQDVTIHALKAMMNDRFASTDRNFESFNSATIETLFLATISAQTIEISDEEPIIFDTDPINPGGHYNTILGAYTAPVHGNYQFSIGKRSNEGLAHFWLLVDEQRYLYYDGYFEPGQVAPTGTATVNLELTAGQIVRVENRLSSIIYGTNSDGTIQSWFTGYMMYAL